MFAKLARACIGAVVLYAAERGAEAMWPSVTPWTWWGGAAAIAMIWVAVEVWLYRRRLLKHRAKSSKRDGFIPLADAMVRAWKIEEIRRLPEFEKLARERPQDVLRRLAERIFDGGDPSLSILGVVGEPPLEQLIEHPHEYEFVNDLTEIAHITGDGRRYRELRVRWSDIERSIRQRTGKES